MTGEKVKAVCDIYMTRMSEENHPPIRLGDLASSRLSHENEALCHVHWMAIETKKFVNEGRLDKAFRWLGFMQGWLTFLGIYTIEETMRHNMPTDVVFDGGA